MSTTDQRPDQRPDPSTATYPTDRPTDRSTDRPTATYPTADRLAHLEREEAAHRERLADLWADATPTEELPAVPAVPDRPATQQARSGRTRRHLRAALAGVLAASALLTGLSLYAADGISSARQAAIEQARSQAAQPAPQQASPATGTDADQPDWVTHGTDAPYDRTDPAASPLDLPRCTTSQDTPLPCLASTFPQNSNENPTRVVVLEEDASLTALVRR